MLFALMVEFPGGPPPPKLLEEHVAWLVPRFEEGSFLLSGGLDAIDERQASALALFTAPSLEDARRLVADEPLYNAGVVTHRVVPFTLRVRTTKLDTRFGDDLRVVPVAPTPGQSDVPQ
jgi:uncharacterized protein YciI